MEAFYTPSELAVQRIVKMELLSPTYPPVFVVHLEDEELEDVVGLFSEDILGDVTNKDVEHALIEYVTQAIEPVGWRGIWRARKKFCGLPFDCDFLVEVLNVSLTSLEADVQVISLLSEGCSGVAAVTHIVESSSIYVPLIELYVVCDDDPCVNTGKTAVVIENIRFFYTQIWRPWDDPEDDDEPFSVQVYSRVKLCQDISHNFVPAELEARANMILCEGWEIRERLDELQRNMPLSDSESELKEEDVAETFELKMRLEELCREMEILENPLLRDILFKDDFLRQPLQCANARKHDGPVVHLVAESFTLAKLQLLNVDPEACLEFHHSLGLAVSSATSGDKILMLPGIHTCTRLPWFETEVTVEGLGNRDETTLTLYDAGDISFNCSSQRLSISNITIQSSAHVKCLIMLHTGSLRLQNCHLDGSTADTCLTVLKNAELTMEECEISNAMVDGISVRPGGIIKAKNCNVSNCKRNGIIVEHEAKLQPTTAIDLEETTVKKNGSYGILVQNVPPDLNSNLETMMEEGFGDTARPCLGVSTKKSTFEDNSLGSFGIENIQC